MQATLLDRITANFAAVEPYIFPVQAPRAHILAILLQFSHVPRKPHPPGIQPVLEPMHVTYNRDHTKRVYIGRVAIPVHVLYNDLSPASVAALNDDNIVMLHVTGSLMDEWMVGTIRRLACTELELAEFASQGLGMWIPNPCLANVFRTLFPLSVSMGIGGHYDCLLQGGCDALYRIAQCISKADRQLLLDISRCQWVWPETALNLLIALTNSVGVCVRTGGTDVSIENVGSYALTPASSKLRLLLLMAFTHQGRCLYTIWQALRVGETTLRYLQTHLVELIPTLNALISHHPKILTLPR